MRLGMFGGEAIAQPVGQLVAHARAAADDGFDSYWVPQVFSHDALTALAVVGREVGGIELGTAVVPTYPRHPLLLAQQALTAADAADGRLVLGIGPSHQVVVEGALGLRYDRPLRHLREFLDVLMPAVRREQVDIVGETLEVHGSITLKSGASVSVLLAALGPKMLELAGRRADGTVTWLVGPRTLAAHTVPTIRASAMAAGRDEPRVVAMLPACVTDDADAARRRAARIFAGYSSLPAYRAMFDREGVGGAEGVALVGDEKDVAEGVTRLAEAGVTDLVIMEFADRSGGEVRRTRECFAQLARSPIPSPGDAGPRAHQH
jgi:F420-dependent oxidoreductase-like protein